MSISVITDILASMIRITTPILLMALGGMMCQRARIFNIALEGFALVGAFFAVAFVQLSGGSVWAGLLGSVIAGAAFSSIFALFVTKFHADHIIASIALNMLAAGLTAFLLRAMFHVKGSYAPDVINKLAMIKLPVLGDIPILGALSGQSVVTYFALVIAVCCGVYLFRTKPGLEVWSVGESEEAARTAGINPVLIKWKVILFSGAMCGLAGAYLSIISVSQFTENMVQGRGFTAFAAFTFGNAFPAGTALVSLFFGLTEAIGIRIQLLGLKVSPSVVNMFPYIMAIAALAISSYTAKMKVKGFAINSHKNKL
jgi:simple sugar transport system permease protein